MSAGPFFSLFALIVPLLLVVVAFCLLVVGWRGRVVGAQPVCRKCGFDLTGRPAASTACPECGADLRKLHAIRSGHVQRRKGIFLTGVVLMLMSATWVGLTGLIAVQNVDLSPYEPLWMLVREMGSSDSLVSEILSSCASG